MSKAVLIQPSFYEAMKILPDNDRLQLYDGLCEYSLNGSEPETLSPMANSLFLLMRPNIDSSNKRYNASIENGKKGGAPKGNQNARKQPKNNQRKQPKNKQDLDLDLDLDLDSKAKPDKPAARSSFLKPSVDDVKAYCTEKGYSINAEYFVDYYESNGWMVGKNKMKDWKAAVRNWATRDQDKAQPEKRSKDILKELGWEVPQIDIGDTVLIHPPVFEEEDPNKSPWEGLIPDFSVEDVPPLR